MLGPETLRNQADQDGLVEGLSPCTPGSFDSTKLTARRLAERGGRLP